MSTNSILNYYESKPAKGAIGNGGMAREMKRDWKNDTWFARLSYYGVHS